MAVQPGLPEGPGIYSNAIVVDGLLYFTTPRVNVIALDAATGKEVWRLDVRRRLTGAGSFPRP